MGKSRRAFVLCRGGGCHAVASMPHTSTYSGCTVATVPGAVSCSVSTAVAVSTTIAISASVTSATGQGRRHKRLRRQDRDSTSYHRERSSRCNQFSHRFHDQ
jgi:hypothetical protein